MRVTRTVSIALAALPLAACVATPPPGSSEPEERVLGADGTCNAAPAQALIGQTATQELAARVLQLTTATAFRWAPPDSMRTMDYRQDRVTVHYDRGMRVTRIACG
jgi:hypothetical protein